MDEAKVIAHLKAAMDLKEDPAILTCQERKLSIIFEFRCGDETFILKLPKPPRKRVRSLSEIQPREKYVRKAEIEWKSFSHLYKQTLDTACPISFVEPIAFIEALPGVVTRKVEGKDLYKTLLVSSHSEDFVKCEDLLKKIGIAFAFMHARNPAGSDTATFPVLTTLKPINGVQPERVFRDFSGYPIALVNAMTGFSVTDIVVDPQGNLFFLDPGKMETRPAFEDLAKFIVELRKACDNRRPSFRQQPSDDYERVFLDGYTSGGKEIDRKLLAAYVLKRWLEEIARIDRKRQARVKTRIFAFFPDKRKKLEALSVREIRRLHESLVSRTNK